MFGTTPPRNDYIGTGALATYSFGFRIFAATDLQVTQTDLNGVSTTLLYPGDFTVPTTSINNPNGGTITLVAGNLTTGYALTIRFFETTNQPTDLRNQGGFFLDVIEDMVDRAVRFVQQNEDALARSLHVPTTEVGTPTLTTLPSKVARALKYLGFDASGNPTALGAPASTTTVSAYMAGVITLADVTLLAAEIGKTSVTPAQITANQNDYNPAGWSAVNTLFLSTDASRNLTGLTTGASGRLAFLFNIGSFPIILISESASSTAANRFTLAGNTVLLPNQGILLRYDATASRWRPLSTDPTVLLSTKGDLLIQTTAGLVRFPVGSINGQMPIVDSAQTAGLKYAAPPLQQYVRGLYLRNHPDSDKVNSQLMLVKADEIGFGEGTIITGWSQVVVDKTLAGAGGLDTGAMAASTWYEVYAISKSSDGVGRRPWVANDKLMLHRAKDYFLDTSFITATNAVRNLRLLTSTATDKLAEGIKFATAGLMEFIDVPLIRVGAVVGNYWFTLESDNAGSPSGTVLAQSDKYDASKVPTAEAYIRIPFRTPFSALTATQYHLVLQGDYARSDTVFIGWRGVTAGGYANGVAKEFNGTTWSATANPLNYDFKAYITRNSTAVTMPTGYDQKTLIGYVYNDGSSNFKRMRQKDRTYHAVGGGTVDRISTTLGTTAALYDLSAFIPPTIVDVLLTVDSGAATTTAMIGDIGATDVATGFLAEGSLTLLHPQALGAQKYNIAADTISLEFQASCIRADSTLSLWLLRFTW
jgi:hypothetical protein